MRRIVAAGVVVAVIAAVWLYVGTRESSVATEGDVMALQGTVRFFDLEGGFFAIQADDGKTYDPVNLDAEYKKDGLRVRFTARRRDDVITTRMIGPTIEIVTIEKI